MAVSFSRTPPRTGGAWKFVFMGIDGELLPMESFRGLAILVVNISSRSSFSRQLLELQAIYEQYRERGLIVLGIPSGDFSKNEFESDQEIRDYCKNQYGATFPMTGKTMVLGAARHPFFDWAAEQVSELGQVKWDFHKFLISPDGRIVDWFSSVSHVSDTRLKRIIERYLPFPPGFKMYYSDDSKHPMLALHAEEAQQPQITSAEVPHEPAALAEAETTSDEKHEAIPA